MGSPQRGTVYPVVKTNKVGSKVAVSTHKGAEGSNAIPHRGHAFASSQRGATISHGKSEPAHPITTEYPRFFSPQSGPNLSSAPSLRGTEARPRTETSRQISPHRKTQQTQTAASHNVSIHRNVTLPREETVRKNAPAAVRESAHHSSLNTDARTTRRLSFLDPKDNLEVLQQEEEPPSKVQNPQGVRVPRKISLHPRDEAVQTDPIRRTLTAADTKSSRTPSSPEHGICRFYPEPRTMQRRIPGQESEMGPHSSIYSDAKPLQKNVNLESCLKFSVLRDLEGGHRVSPRPELDSAHKYSVYTEPKSSTKVSMGTMESGMKSSTRDGEFRKVTISQGGQPTQRAARAVPESYKSSGIFAPSEPIYKQHVQRPPETVHTSSGPIPKHVELELTPRPLPPRSLPRYGPDSSWWTLLNPEVEMPESRQATPNFEPKSPAPLDSLLSFFEKDSNSFYEELTLQREKASPLASPPASSPPPPAVAAAAKQSPNQAPLREAPQAPKHTSKQPIQRFSAFFLDVSEEMYNRVIWWLKGLCFSLSRDLLWVVGVAEDGPAESYSSPHPQKKHWLLLGQDLQ
ncbi:PREDICTED: uncharacterized protein C17orf47 homolog [Chrysochloris asiatica]|uniref:Uncharacterized protein C17orf47 homolog n=1 Tax=Chrysochloris asiatica TaxID=185453 RepID=A0A9B0T1L5_CHRAS|nr:PREDICTED: uncharacterized protein C17orf47 homolog [Chrysochloris asiatica]